MVVGWGCRPLDKLVLKGSICGAPSLCQLHPDTIRLVEEGKVDLATVPLPAESASTTSYEGFDTLITATRPTVKILVSPSGSGL